MSNRTKGRSIGFCAAAAVVLVAAGAITRLSIADSPKKEPGAASSVHSSSVYTASYSDSRNILDKASEDLSRAQNGSSANEPTKTSGNKTDSTTDPSKKSGTASADKSTTSGKSDSTSKSEKAENAAGTKTVSFALPLKGDIIRKFDMTQLVYSKTFGDMRVHNGIDIKAKDGETVLAAADGTVKEVREDPLWGNTVVIDHGGSILSYYCGLNDVTVKVGDKVKLSRIIGTVGECAAECLDETHLHFSMTQNGEYVSPLKIMGLGE